MINLKEHLPAEGDFTLEMWAKRTRSVRHWRGKKMILHPRWVHIAQVRDASGTRFYADGKLVRRERRRVVKTMIAQATEALRDAGSFPGHLDELRVSNIARYTGEGEAP